MSLYLNGGVRFMFKIEKPEYVNKTFRMEKKLVEQLEQLAQNENISVNSLVIQCCNYALDNLVLDTEKTPNESKKEEKKHGSQ